MARITGLKRWLKGEVLTARDYVYERDSIVNAVNELYGLFDGETPFNAPSIVVPVDQFTQADFITPGTIFYDSERHALVYITDLGEYLEIGSNLGDFGKNTNGQTWEGQPVTLVGVQGASPVKEFSLADASNPDLSTMVGVLTTSPGTVYSGRLEPNEFGKISVFGDITIPDFAQILDSTFLSDLELENIADIPFGTKLYLSTEAGKYSANVPSLPNSAIWVATVIDVKPNETGRIFVYPQKVRLDGQSTIYYSTTQPSYLSTSDLWIDLGNTH